ncbi:MAG TPA: FAD-dependent oxidoreductase [Pyrinomonadaceae bacterium]|nr:FAD-dependent oxidoreductase [Pyrinomonadaceae bacterium]
MNMYLSDKSSVLPDTRLAVAKRTRVAILGGGPAGLGAAWQLARQGKADAIVLEQRDDVGGNAGSFELDGLAVDYGSHRLHPACQPQILEDLRQLLKDDLLDRPRHGRIRLRGQWIHFPLKPLDLLRNVPLSFVSGVAIDSLRKFVPRSNGKPETFASVLERGLGSTICNDFYFPYALKIWGLPPQELSATQARRRVSAGSMRKMARKVLALVPGIKSSKSGRFFYPHGGYGQISRALASAACKTGVDIQLRTTVHRLNLGDPHQIQVQSEKGPQTLTADYIWSTIPLSVLARITHPQAPPEVLDASRRIEFRAMILIYLVLDQHQWTPFDAHYFPEADSKLTRLSEPKNYSGRTEPKGRTVLCGELPCMVNDDLWNASDERLAALVSDSLKICDLPIESTVLKVATKRLPYAYPIYRQGYEQYFDVLDGWVNGLERVLTFGRQGLFAHDNTHHALAMAYGAVDCLQESGEFDMKKWHDYRAEFAEHVVED